MRTIGIEVAPEHGFGRAFLEGVSEYAARKCDARLVSLAPNRLKNIKKIDGLILRLLNDKVAVAALAYGVPIVDIYGEKPRLGIAQVYGAYQQIAQIAANLFLSRHYKNIAWCGIGGLNFSTQTERHFIAAVQAAGLSVKSYNSSPRQKGIIVTNAPDHIPDAEELRQWICHIPKPCAVFCCNDHRAFQLMRVATESGLSIPEEVSILGIDNDSTLCAFADIPLSSIDPNAFRNGQVAARVLDVMMTNSPQFRLHKPILVPPKGLVERQSTQHYPISPAWLSKVLLSIERNLEKGINASEAIGFSNRSSTAVERIFKDRFGCSVIEYITEQKMKRAQKLLKNSNLMIKEVAIACGFSSQQYFCRVFKSFYKKNPTQIREEPNGC